MKAIRKSKFDKFVNEVKEAMGKELVGTEQSRLDGIAERLFGFFASRGCRTEFYDGDGSGCRVLDVSHRDRDGLVHVYFGCFPDGTPDAECKREAVRDLAHMPSGRYEGRPVTAFGYLDLGGIRSFEELELRLTVMGA